LAERTFKDRPGIKATVIRSSETSPVVLADGRVIRTAGRARKSAAGYDLTRLFVGSEGTLGVITEVTVRLYGIPAAISAAVCSFATVEAAVNAVIQTIQAGVPVARIEVANAIQMDAINKYSKLELSVAPTLWLECHGTEASVAEQAEMVQKNHRRSWWRELLLDDQTGGPPKAVAGAT
jgi:D-lactate dehydrogenase (cytochrome)